jgi:hypothetical protein
VGQFAVAAPSERPNSLRIQDRRSETTATKIELSHYPWVIPNLDQIKVLTSHKDAE